MRRIFSTVPIDSMDTMPRRPLRVCHVAYTFYESDNRVMRYVQALAGRGDDVDVVSLRAPGRPWREFGDGVRFYLIQRRSPTEKNPLSYLVKLLWFSLKATLLLTALQVRRRYDVVHVHNVPDFLVFTAWLPQLMGARVILDVHDILPELYAGKFQVGSASAIFRALVALERMCCRFADHVVVANHLWHGRLIVRSVPPEHCTTMMNYPDLSVFKPRFRPGRPAQAGFLVLYPGTLNHHQGVDIAVRAFARVSSQMPDAEFHVYGRGPTLNDLINLSRELRMDGRVKFMESVGLKQIAGVMATASVGVVPKRADGFGNEAFSTKILEFMACGVPVIVSRTKVDQYYFTDDLVSFFEPGSVEDLANALLRAYRHRDEPSGRVAAAHRFADGHSWQVRSAEYVRLVDSLTDSNVRHASAGLQETR